MNPTRGETVHLRLEVVGVAMAAAVPEGHAHSALLDPHPAHHQLHAVAELPRQHAPVAATATRGVTVRLCLEVVVVAMAAAVPEAHARALQLVPQPAHQQLRAVAELRGLLAPVAATATARRHS